MSEKLFTNRLAQESSPYLKQHSHNPVDWYPWGKEALEKAKSEGKAIFLSIGYAACHWCHVMERESFEDAETAQIMNQHFINIKVDREERPDLDHIYMSAVQILTRHGGWPMSVFLTPELKPFYGGTYFPPEDRMGLPSFKKVLGGIAQAWETRKAEIELSANQLSEAVGQMFGTPTNSGAFDLSLVDSSIPAFLESYDPQYGGFGSSPKFFHTMDMKVLLRHWKRTGNEESLEAVTSTLEKLSRGGIFDQIGGGFHRYSTDRYWLVPHFEKMLYDNALLTEVYLEAYQATKKVGFAHTVRETLNYILRDMCSPEGAYYSTEDADSEGVEGKFYVWQQDEIEKLLGKEVATSFCRVFGVKKDGNWEDTNILHMPNLLAEMAKQLGVEIGDLQAELDVAKRKLLGARSVRKRPLRDEKILTSWNGMMIHSMSMAFQVLGEETYLESAQKAARFLLKNVRKSDGRLFHSYQGGKAKHDAYLDDYAILGNALVTLYESDFDENWIVEAKKLAKLILEDFWDAESRSFYYTAHHHETLVVRPKEIHDGATPSATSMAVTFLSRLGHLVGEVTWDNAARSAIETLAGFAKAAPSATAQLLVAMEFLLDHPKQIVLVWKEEEAAQEFLRKLRSEFIPNKVVAASPTEKPPKSLAELFKGRTSKTPVTAFVCEGFQCQSPVSDVDSFSSLLRS